MAAGNLITASSLGDSLHIRIISAELDFQTLIVFNPEETVWEAKQKIISSICRDIKDGLNYGLYCPSVNNRAGKFLEEERPLKDYPLPGPIGLLEFKYKKRVYKMQSNPTKLKKLHTSSNLKKFMEYIHKGDADRITEMTDRGLDPNFFTSDKGDTPLTLAATLQRPRSVMMALISGGAYLDFRNRKGMTAMHVAAEVGNRDAIKTLLDLGASPNYKDTHGLTPLYYGVIGNTCAQCVQMLLHDRAEICNRDNKGWTEIHHACKNGRVQHLEHLLFYGADINAKTLAGDTALHICARNNQEECARALMFRGADKSIKNLNNEDAFTVAQLAGHEKLAEIIGKFGSEDVVLYTELPKYNEKRRGTISAATVRNLQRSRSNPQLNRLFSQDENHPSSLSSAGGYQFLSNGFLFANGTSGTRVRLSTEVSSGTTSPVNPAVSHIELGQFQSECENISRTLFLQREPTGFGFILRGAKARGSINEKLKFTPTPQCPALQYFDSVERGSVAEKAGLLAGDFLLEINGEDVLSASHDHTVSLIKKSGNQVTMKVITVTHHGKGKGEFVHQDGTKTCHPLRTAGQVRPVLTSSSSSLSPSIGSSVKSTLAGLEELERLDATLDKYDNEIERVSTFGSRHNSMVIPVYTSGYDEQKKENSTNRTENFGKVSHRTSVHVTYHNEAEAKHAQNLRSTQGINEIHAEPEPDYDGSSSSYGIKCQQATDPAVSEDLKENSEDGASDGDTSTFALMIKQATLNRERRIKERENLDAVVKEPTAPPPKSLSNQNIPFPPPPPRISSCVSESFQQQQPSNGTPGGSKPVPPEVQKNLEENRKRDEAHAILMAAVLKRRNLLESADESEMADSIENRLQKTKKIQVIYRGNQSKQEQMNLQSTTPMSSAILCETNTGKSGSFNGENNPRIMTTALKVTPPPGNVQDTRKQVPLVSSRPARTPGSLGQKSVNFADIVSQRTLEYQMQNGQDVSMRRVSNTDEIFEVHVQVKGTEIKGDRHQQPVWHNNQTPKNQNTLNALSHKYGYGSAVTCGGFSNTDIIRYSDRVTSDDASSTISSLSTLSTLSSLGPENSTSAGNSPPTNAKYLSKVETLNSQNQSRSRIPEYTDILEPTVGLIPPPAEFSGDDFLYEKESSYSAMPVAATLRSVNKTPLGNSMHFPARVKDTGMFSGNAKGSSFAEKSIERWTVADVGDWLESLDYGVYRKSFADTNVTGHRLVQLNQNDLVTLGVEQVLHRIRLEREIRKLSKLLQMS